ncbi:acyl-CoA dehydrogenase family protein [Mesorhizobium australicum]|uniref:Acyl-CoA dehydrogenase, N-terminal domain n=1 Tax=Mesorhizobium australicum TaxID=536018 RepID=A0A1X7PLL6_9HYPH|nr:acyl-CoA dehydrogenase family protein [Mesorhizobium australicum]SMH51698.1 Acyl-CoA dehydrogenase, N-terminal domain [Mesorhizobium australicum]
MTCDLNHGEEQRQIIDAAVGMLRAHYPVARRRKGKPDDLSEAAAFGTFGLALTEEEGGAGFSLVEEALVHVLFGRHVISSGSLAMALGARLARAAGQGDLADQIIAGETFVCAGIQSGDTVLLPEPGEAEIALVFGARELELCAIDAVAVRKEATPGQGAAAHRMPRRADGMIAGSAEQPLLAIADLLVSAQLLGIAEAARDLAVTYAQVRQQFGQPIGGFQAIKHHCANMAIGAEMLSCQLDMAAIALRDEREDAGFQVAALRRLAPGIALTNARLSIQVHGGIGFSAEADAHHYLKHAHVLSRLGAAADILDLPAPLAPLSVVPERN